MKKVLIVDSLKSLIDKEKSLLNRSDIRISTATSSEEALAIHRSGKMDLIITDLDMPGISGDKLCSIIRKDEDLKHVSIIIICSGSRSDIERIKRCKANLHVVKPIRPVQFLESVSSLLDVPERKSYRVLLKATITGKFNNEPFFCSSQNISVSGLLIETEKQLEKGDLLSCSFFLPGSGSVITEAEVMRTVQDETGSFKYGIRYVGISPAYRDAIDKFIEKRSGNK